MILLSDFKRRFQEYIRSQQLFSEREELLLAVSGGIDSVVLCQLCHACGYRFSIAHMNFSLRGAESDGDAAFVKSLAESFGVPYYGKTVETEVYARENGCSIQVAARELRYHWLLTLLAKTTELNEGPTKLLTAHHENDSVETLLMNFLKGTGIRGLHGIPAANGQIARPLLFAKKAEILEYATEQGLSWREDSSNATEKYSRNFIRLNVMPVLEKLYPTVENNLAGNIRRFKEAESLYLERIAQLKKKLLTKNSRAEWQLPVTPISQLPYKESFFVEVLADFGFSPQQASEANKLLEASPGKYISSDSHRLIRDRKWLLLVPVDHAQISRVIIDSEGCWDFPEGRLEISTVNSNIEQLKNLPTTQACIDTSELSFPLTLRRWKTGDYFYPLGLNKKKKIARFLIDEKMSLPQKERQWILESDQRVVWILGKRLDHRFRVRTGTAPTYLLIWHPRTMDEATLK